MYCIGQRPPTSQCVVTYLLRVLKVLEEGVLIPRHTLVDVGGRVAEALDLTRLAAEDAVQVRADYTGEKVRGGRCYNVPLLGPPASIVWH